VRPVHERIAQTVSSHKAKPENSTNQSDHGSSRKAGCSKSGHTRVQKCHKNEAPLRPNITELTSVLVGQVLQLKIGPGKPRLSKRGAAITGHPSRSSLVTALTLLTCKFYQFLSLHNLRSLVSGSCYQAPSPAMSTALTCGMAWGRSLL
jgi:hypothetical protein